MAGHQVFNVEDNWLPMSWAAAQTEEFLFTNDRMNIAYATASSCYESWRSERNNENRIAMEVAVKAYLDMASSEKELIKKTAWGGMGVTFVSMKTRSFIYFALAILGLVFGIAALACEDFPGKVTKPGLVIAYDCVVETILFALIMWQAQQPGRWAVWFSTSGVMGLAASVGRAMVIAATVKPKAPIETDRDRWNAIGTGCTNAIKWIYPLMARPVDRVPGIAPGEPFHDVRLCGAGLNNQERSRLLEVVMTVRSCRFVCTRSLPY